jgi:sugar lactone lactonase YvrE
MRTLIAEEFAAGLAFPECPRWHDGRLWFVDQVSGEVMTVGADGRPEGVVAVPGDPGGIGWLPDGRLLVVAMRERRLMVWSEGELHLWADLSHIEPASCNDMIIDGAGRAYVSGFGFDLFAATPTPASATLGFVARQGEARAAAEGLFFPNGMALSADRRTLIVAETLGRSLAAFDVAADGALSDRRVYAPTGDATPDGIALDAAGGVWFGSPTTEEFLRVLPGGEVTHRIATPGRWAVACALGGDDGRTLYLCVAETTMEQRAQNRSRGWIMTARTDVPAV